MARIRNKNSSLESAITNEKTITKILITGLNNDEHRRRTPPKKMLDTFGEKDITF